MARGLIETMPRARSAAAFARTAASALGPLLGASKAVFVARRPAASGPLRASPDDVHFVAWPDWCKAHYCRHVQPTDPIARWIDSPELLTDDGVVRLSDLVPTRRLLAAPYFMSMLQPSGARYVLSVALRDGAAVTGVLSLVRDADAGDFDANHRTLVRALAPLLAAAWRGMPAAPAPPASTVDCRLGELTAREREVVALVVAGHVNKEIARRLGVSPWTVKNHLRAVFEKTGVRTRTALAALALSA